MTFRKFVYRIKQRLAKKIYWKAFQKLIPFQYYLSDIDTIIPVMVCDHHAEIGPLLVKDDAGGNRVETWLFWFDIFSQYRLLQLDEDRKIICSIEGRYPGLNNRWWKKVDETYPIESFGISKGGAQYDTE